MSFSKLVRYQAGDKIVYGELVEASASNFNVKRLDGNFETGFQNTSDEAVKVKSLLCLIEKTPIIICIGLNYQQHAREANVTIPPYPVVFTKPADALAGPFENLSIHPGTQGMLDYEGELTVLMGQDAKNVSEAKALDYVAGYTAGNDLSARNFQLPEVSGGQFCYGKSFDAFAPIGPAIISANIIKDPQKLKYATRGNGEIRPETGMEDMIWSVRQIIAHLSRGTTLRKGTLIMTGTPSGVGFFQEKFIQDGNVVEVGIEGIGKIANKIVSEKQD